MLAKQYYVFKRTPTLAGGDTDGVCTLIVDAPIVYGWGFELGPSLVMYLSQFAEEKRAGCFTFNVFLLSCGGLGFVSLLRGAVG